ncbi:MAG: hypothetical protein AAGF96_18915 [Bacteroidota bacterium]
MNYKELITRLVKIVDQAEYILRVNGDVIFIDADEFYLTYLNKILFVLNRYGEVDWWIKPSNTFPNRVMIKVIVLTVIE